MIFGKLLIAKLKKIKVKICIKKHKDSYKIRFMYKREKETNKV